MIAGKLKQLGNTIDALNLRERGMLLLIVVLLIWALWQTLLMGPLSERQQALAQRVETASNTINALNQIIPALSMQRARDPLAAQREQLQQLRTQRAQVADELTRATSSLIEPRQMGTVLEAILARQQGLVLHSLSSLDPKPLPLEEKTGLAPIYRHGLRIEVDGGYLDLLQFVQALERMPWAFIWEDMQIEVEEHPRSRLRLTLYTLSLGEGWLGV